MNRVQEQNEYCGITKWHDAGITGKGVTIWNMENGKATHGKQTTQRVKDAAPDAIVINGSLGMTRNNKEIKSSSVTTDDGTMYDVEEFIKTFGIKLVTRSQHGGAKADGVESKFWKPLKEKYNLIFFNSAGNKASDGTNGGLPPDIAIYVAACGLIDGKPKRDHWYSSIGEEVDFIDFRGELTGTSFSAPYLCGKAALLVQKYGNQITQDEVYEYFKEHAEDIEEAGHDYKSGWGLPIMGDPKTVITMKIGSNVMEVDGRKVELDQGPIIQNKRTLVPIRAISEALGAEVGWDDKTKTVTIVR